MGEVLAKHPERVIKHSVRGMLPHNALGRKMLRKLKVYASATHPDAAQFRASEKQEQQDDVDRPGQRLAQQLHGLLARKTSVARVLLQPGPGNIIINGIPFEQRFPRPSHQAAITLPLRLTNRLGRFNLLAKVIGGGVVRGRRDCRRHRPRR